MQDTNTLDAPADTSEGQQVDYFGCDVSDRVFLPDGKSYIEVKKLTEGDRRKYMNKVNRDIRVDRASGDAHLRMSTGDERFVLLESAISGWNLVQRHANGDIQPVAFTKANVTKFLESTDPVLLDPIEKKIRDMNPWLTPSELTVEDIDEQIEQLQEERQKLIERDQGN